MKVFAQEGTDGFSERDFIWEVTGFEIRGGHIYANVSNRSSLVAIYKTNERAVEVYDEMNECGKTARSTELWLMAGVDPDELCNTDYWANVAASPYQLPKE